MISILVGMSGACGGGDGPDGGAEHIVTFDTLSPEEHAQFEAWKKQPFKACSWEQAFPQLAAAWGQALPSDPSSRVDHAALLAANAGSPLLVFGGGELVMLGEPIAERAWSPHTYDATRSTGGDGGRTQKLTISSTLNNGTCIVAIGTQEVFRAALPAQVPMVLSHAQVLPNAPTADLSTLEDAPGGEPIARTDGNRLLRHVLAQLTPSAITHGVMAAHYGVSTEVIAARFPLAAARAPELVRLRWPTGMTSFAPGIAGSSLLGTRAQLQPLYEGAAFELELLFGGVATGRLALRAEMTSTRGGLAVRARSITVAPIVPFDDAAMLACFEARDAARHFEPTQALAPAFGEQYLGCAALAADGYAALASSPQARTRLTQKAMSAAGPQYRGWDDALIQVAQRAHERGVDLAALGQLGAVLPRWRTLQGSVAAEHPERPLLERALVALVFRWHFRALSPSDALVAELRAAVASAAADFPASVKRMLEDLSNSLVPTARGSMAMRCGQAFIGARREQVLRARDAATLVIYSQPFLEAFDDSFLQECPSDASVAALETSAAAVTAFLRADAERDGGSSTFALYAASVVDHALAQRWSAATFDALADVLAYAAVSKHTLCGRSSSQSQQAVCVDSSFEILGTEPGGLLAPSVAARNAELARTLTARWPELADFSFFTARFDLQDAYFAGMWLSCDDAGFARSRTKLLDRLSALRRATTFEDRLAIEAELRTLEESETCP